MCISRMNVSKNLSYGGIPQPKKRKISPAIHNELRQLNELLYESRNQVMKLAKENVQLKILLRKYMENDDSLLSTSQLSCSQQSCNENKNKEGNEVEFPSLSMEATIANENLSDSFIEDSNLLSSQDIKLASQEVDDSIILSQISEFGSLSQLEDVMEYLEKQNFYDATRVETLESDNYFLRKGHHVVRVGIGTIIYCQQTKNVLVGKRKGSHGEGRWALPGGHLEIGETWESCALREIKEETDLVVSKEDLSFAGVTNDYMKEENRHYITIFFNAQLDKELNAKNMEPEKCTGWEWKSWNFLQNCMNDLFLPLQHYIQIYTPSKNNFINKKK